MCLKRPLANTNANKPACVVVFIQSDYDGRVSYVCGDVFVNISDEDILPYKTKYAILLKCVVRWSKNKEE